MYSKKFHNILDEINEFSLENEGQVWFRGHSKSKYSLKSSLYRLKYEQLQQYIDLENQQLELLDINNDLLQITGSDIEKLYLMQHYGMRTRLLDWTASIAIALYFLVEDLKGQDTARLWMLNPCKLNELGNHGCGVISPKTFEIKELQQMENSIAIYPIRNNKRIIAQHGFFTVQGNTCLSLEEEFDKSLIRNGYLKSIDITFEVKNDIIRYLQINNINAFTIFPDMEGLKRYVNEGFIEDKYKE